MPILAAVMLVTAASVMELWQAPPGWLKPARRADVHVLNWLHMHWLNASAIAAIAAIAAALIPLFIWSRDHRQGAKTPGQLARDRDVMLRRVHRKWITDVLEPSLEHAARLALGLQTRPDVLHIAMRITRGPDRQPEPIPEGKPVLEVFEEASSSLLILGAPGAGKTTLLLQLASALIDRASRDPVQPIPVVINLESWPSRRQELNQWLVDELVESYGVPQSIANAWMADGELVLLLDGLDEVAEHYRPACAAAINDYRRDHGLAGLVVCSRTQELQQLAVRLQLEAAVELQPPTDVQIGAFLDYLENTGTPLAEVRAAIATDQTLRELLSSPLTLNVIALAYHGREPTALGRHGAIENREKMLWKAYVKRMFEQRPLPPGCHYTADHAVAWLRWLARALQTQKQSEFRIDRLTREWVPGGMRPPHTFSLPPSIDSPLQRGLFIWRHTITYWRVIPSALKLYTELAKEADYDSAMNTDYGALALAKQLVEMAVGILIAGAATGLAAGLIEGMVAGLAAALITLLGTLLVYCVILMVLLDADFNEWSNRRRQAKQALSPNEGIRHAARRALNVSLAAFLAFGASAALGFSLGFRPTLGFSFGLSLGLWFALWLGMTSGGTTCLQHYAVRAALAGADAAPWRYEPFLDAMVARLLLRRSGSGYQFIHRLLRDFLADNPAHKDAAGILEAQ